VYECGECGAQSPKWLGRCAECGAWNTLVESAARPSVLRPGEARGDARVPVDLSAITAESVPRVSTSLRELDRVLGGGLVPGAVVLIGGDPGIGKSTLMLQAAGAMGTGAKKSVREEERHQGSEASRHQGEERRAEARVLYVSSEESAEQVKLRAARLGIAA